MSYPFHCLMQLNIKDQWSGSWPGHLTPETWCSNTGWMWPLPTPSVCSVYFGSLAAYRLTIRTIRLRAAKQDLYKPVSFIKQKWKTTLQTSLSFMWCRAVLGFFFVFCFLRVQDRWWDILLSTPLLPSSSWLMGPRLPNSIPQSPGPLWCSWWPSPTSEDPGWARDCQGSLSRRATSSGDQSCAQQSDKPPCKSFLVTSAYKAPIMQNAARVFSVGCVVQMLFK